MSSITYDYAIIGAGAAGLNLAAAMSDNPFFQDKQLLILEKDPKSLNDKTWCFWEKGDNRWDDILHHKWSQSRFFSKHDSLDLELSPYQYKMLRSIDLYEYAGKQLRERVNIHWKQDEVKALVEGDTVEVKGESDTYSAKQVFDSRIHEDFSKNDDSYLRVLQHFKGWTVKTEKPVFDPDRFVIMDFRMTWKDQASFTYILPTSENQALVEFTLFTPDLISDPEYDGMLEAYLAKILETNYNILEVEKGVIPMTNYPFHRENSRSVTKIGTAGSWVKPSSGYSFRNCQVYAQKIVENLKSGLPPDRGIISKRHRLYDTLFLDILQKRNHLGNKLFTSMYMNNSIQQIFKFLDEETNLAEEIKIVNSFESSPFLKALVRQARGAF